MVFCKPMCLVVESATDQALSQKMYEIFYGYGGRMKAVNELFTYVLEGKTSNRIRGLDLRQIFDTKLVTLSMREDRILQQGSIG